MRYPLAFFATLVLWGCGGCRSGQTDLAATQGQADWKDFVSPAGRFAVLMPGIPDEKEDVIATELGPLTDHAFTLKDQQHPRRYVYTLSYTDYPPGHTQQFDPNDFLERAWQGSFSNLADRLVYKQRTTLNGFAGLAFQYRGKGTFLVTARSYLVHDRIYQLSAIMPKEQLDKGDGTKYLESFRLLK